MDLPFQILKAAGNSLSNWDTWIEFPAKHLRDVGTEPQDGRSLSFPTTQPLNLKLIQKKGGKRNKNEKREKEKNRGELTHLAEPCAGMTFAISTLLTAA